MARKKKWSPNSAIIRAVEAVIARMSEKEKQKRIATIGFSRRGRAFTIEELLDEYRKGSRIGQQFESVLIMNTVERLKG